MEVDAKTQEAGEGGNRPNRPLQTLKGIRAKLAKVILDLESGELDEKVGRAMIYGCATLADIIKGADIEAKLKRMEMRDKRRESPEQTTAVQ